MIESSLTPNLSGVLDNVTDSLLEDVYIIYIVSIPVTSIVQPVFFVGNIVGAFAEPSVKYKKHGI